MLLPPNPTPDINALFIRKWLTLCTIWVCLSLIYTGHTARDRQMCKRPCAPQGHRTKAGAKTHHILHRKGINSAHICEYRPEQALLPVI